jgi:hypothetical protein
MRRGTTPRQDGSERTTIMLPLPPVMAWTLAAVGVAAVSRVLAREWRRVNAELDAQELEARARAAEPGQRPTLRRDPQTGIYRPE